MSTRLRYIVSVGAGLIISATATSLFAAWAITSPPEFPVAQTGYMFSIMAMGTSDSSLKDLRITARRYSEFVALPPEAEILVVSDSEGMWGGTLLPSDNAWNYYTRYEVVLYDAYEPPATKRDEAPFDVVEGP